MNFDLARRVANTVRYEGYVLYPYRASAQKNLFRWQFGVVAPRDYSENGGCEPWAMQTECLIESEGDPILEVVLRFLRVQKTANKNWEEGTEQERTFSEVNLKQLLAAEKVEPFEVDNEISALVRLAVEGVGRFLKLRVRIENLTP